MSKTKKIAIQGVILAIMLVFQTMKGISPYITGPIVNLVLIAVTYYFSFWSGLLFSIIAPISSFLISPGILNTIKPIIPCVMLGNAILCFFVNLLKQKNLAASLFIGSTIKGIFMTVAIALIIIPMYANSVGAPIENFELPRKMFSITQFITSYIASVVSYIVLSRVKIKQ